MPLTQTVEIPENRWLNIRVPQEVPAGPVILTFKPLAKLTAQDALERGLGFGSDSRIDPAEAIKQCCGIFKKHDISLSSDDFLETRRQEKELENKLDRSAL